MDMFNCDDVPTLLAKRKQRFAGSFARMDSILYELVAVVFKLGSANQRVSAAGSQGVRERIPKNACLSV